MKLQQDLYRWRISYVRTVVKPCASRVPETALRAGNKSTQHVMRRPYSVRIMTLPFRCLALPKILLLEGIWRRTRRINPENREPEPDARLLKSAKVAVEETTRVVPARRRVAVWQEPVTLSRALGEAAVVESEAEPPVTSWTMTRTRKRIA